MSHVLGQEDCRATRRLASTAEVLRSLSEVLFGIAEPRFDLELDGSRDEYLRVLGAVVQLRDAQDGSQLEKMRAALRQRDRELVLASAAIEHGGIGLSVFRLDGSYVSVNDETCRRTGYTHEEYAHMSIWDTVPEFRPEVLREMWDRYQPTDALRVDTSIVCKDGTRVPVDARIRVIDFEGEQIICALSVDITERVQTREALEESERRFSHAFHGNPVSMALLDGAGFYLEVNRAWELHTGYSAEDALGKHMSELPSWADPDGMLAAADRLVHDGQVEAFEAAFTAADGESRIGRITAEPILFEGHGSILTAIEDITQQKHAEEESRASLQRLEALTQQTIAAMARLVEARDPYTAGHEARVTELSVAIAGKLGLDAQTTAGVKVAAQLHDLGKMVVPAEILAKPGSLSAAEFSLVKQHAEAGARMLADIDFPWPIAQIIRQHHERLDGSGYPAGLSDGEVLLEARIICVADVVEAMSAHRPYRPSLGLDAALAEIERGRGRVYDERAVDACLALFREDGFRFE